MSGPRPPDWRVPCREHGCRVIGIVVFGAMLLGVWKHVEENQTAGPLDFSYAETWDTLSSADQQWKAASKEVGPAPPLAPGAVAFAARARLLATVPWTPPSERGEERA